MSRVTLYTFPFSCSLAVEVVLRQHDVPFDVALVERGPARKVRGEFGDINPKRKVPALLIEGALLTEIASVLVELDRRFVPGRSSEDRRHLGEWSCFVATELHQAVLGPVFDPDAPDGARTDAVERLLVPVLEYVEQSLTALGERPILVGTEPSGADAYLWWAILLLRHHNADVLGPAANRYYEHLRTYSFFRAAAAAHGAMVAGAPKARRAGH